MARPLRSLVGFARVPLAPGATASVTCHVHPGRLAFYDEAMLFVTEPGPSRFAIGGASDRAAAAATVELTGHVSEHRQRDIVATRVSVLPTASTP